MSEIEEKLEKISTNVLRKLTDKISSYSPGKEFPGIYVINNRESIRIDNISQAVERPLDYILLEFKGTYQNNKHTNDKFEYLIVNKNLDEIDLEVLNWKSRIKYVLVNNWFRPDRFQIEVIDPMGVVKSDIIPNVGIHGVMNILKKLDDASMFNSHESLKLNNQQLIEIEDLKKIISKQENELTNLFIDNWGLRRFAGLKLKLKEILSFKEKHIKNVNQLTNDKLNILIAYCFLKEGKKKKARKYFKKYRNSNSLTKDWKNEITTEFLTHMKIKK